jgi:hypothetical protein
MEVHEPGCIPVTGVGRENFMKKAGAALAAIAMLAGAAAMPAPATRLTHELLWTMKRVGAPAVSPDGKWVVFSVLEPSYEPDKER